jgi:hypothetical protein
VPLRQKEETLEYERRLPRDFLKKNRLE